MQRKVSVCARLRAIAKLNLLFYGLINVKSLKYLIFNKFSECKILFRIAKMHSFSFRQRCRRFLRDINSIRFDILYSFV